MLTKHSNFLKSSLLLILRLSAFFVFFGRGWEHLITGAPFRVVLWDQSLMEGLITTLTGLSWSEYASSSTYNFIVDASIKITGLFYIICSVVSLMIKEKHKALGQLLITGSILLALLSLLFYKTKFFQFAQLIEYSCQMFSPLFLYVILFYKVNLSKFNVALKIAIALTFAGHGLYALGIYVTPGMWIDMALSCINFIGLYPSVEQVQHIIYWAGILDMVVAVGIFLPKKWSAPFLTWALVWGLVTALSRVVGFMNIDASWHTLIQWMPQTIIRLPHALIPLAAIIIVYRGSVIAPFNKLQIYFGFIERNFKTIKTQTSNILKQV